MNNAYSWIRNRFVFSILFCSFSLASLQAAAILSQKDFKITPNSKKDQTSAIQKYLQAVADKGGGTAYLQAGHYQVRGSLVVPEGVILEGSWSVPHHGSMSKGTVIEAFGGIGLTEGLGLVELSQSSAIKGVTIVYPEQTLENIQPYPWAIHGQGMHNTVENVTLVNAYQGISIGPEWNELHVIRNVYGCVLRRGVKIAGCTDIGRIENVHFNPHYWYRGLNGREKAASDGKPDPVIATAIKTQQQLEAFIFERTDWEYVSNTFVFGAKIGYRFTGSSENEACNGQFSGIGADMSRYGVVLEKVQPWGVSITNGEFVCGRLDPNNAFDTAAVYTTDTFRGSLQLSNCSFWGYFTHVLRLEGDGFVSLNQGIINNAIGEGSAIEIQNGRTSITSVMFKTPANIPHVYISPKARQTVIAENFAEGGVRIKSEKKDGVVLRDNE